MGIFTEMAQESAIEWYCGKIAKKIEKYPDSAKALKELGLEGLDSLPNVPKWAHEYYKLFKS